MYIDFIIKAILWICFLFSSEQPLTQQMQYIDMTIELPWIHILHMHNRCEVFAEVLAEHANSAGPQSEKPSCIFRASPAQAPRKQKDASRWKWGTGPHVPPGCYSHQNSRQRRLAKYCQRDLSTQRRRKGRQRIAVKERQRKARGDVMSCSSSATSSSDSSDWKKVGASALAHGNWSLSVFVSRFDDCQTRYVFWLREEASRK